MKRTYIIKKAGIVFAAFLIALAVFFGIKAILGSGQQSVMEKQEAGITLIESKNLQSANQLCVINDRAAAYTYPVYEQYFGSFCYIDKEGNVKSAPYKLEKFEKVMDLCSNGQDRLLVLLSKATDVYLKEFDLSGNCTHSWSFSEDVENKRIESVRMDEKGELYVLMEEEGERFLSVYDSQGKLQEQISGLMSMGCLRNIKNGRVAYIFIEEEETGAGTRLAVQTFKDAKADEKYILPIKRIGDFEAIQDGGAYDLYYFDANYLLYGYDLGKKQGTVLVNLYEAGLPVNEINRYGVTENLDIFLSATAYDKEGNYTGNDLYYVKPGATISDKQELVLAVIYPDGLIMEAVEEFNGNSQDYFIRLEDYSQYEEPKKQLVLDMMSGKNPDIICLSDVNSYQLINRQLLEELTPYLENSGLKGKLDSNIINLFSQDEGLYQICTHYTIDGMIVPKDTLADEKMLLQSIGKTGEGEERFIIDINREELLEKIISNNFENLVDYKAKSCQFDTEQFVSVLECANALWDKRLEHMDSYVVMDFILEGIETGRSIGARWDNSSYDICNYQLFSNLYQKEITVVPYPVMEESGVGFLAGRSYGICSLSEHKEAAWRFLEMQLEKDKQLREAGGGLIPVNVEALEEYIKRQTTVEGYMDDRQQFIEPLEQEITFSDMTISLKPASKEEAAQFRKLIASIDHQSIGDEMIFDIVREEAENYFNGEKSSKEAAAEIQNRVSTYLQE